MGGSGYRPRVAGSLHVGGALGDSVLPHGVGRQVFAKELLLQKGCYSAKVGMFGQP